MTVSLTAYLAVGAALFCAGVIAVLSRRNALAILIGIELMLNAANVNLVAFDRFHPAALADKAVVHGQVFTLFVIAIAAAEAAVALAIILNVFDTSDRIDVDRIDRLKG